MDEAELAQLLERIRELPPRRQAAVLAIVDGFGETAEIDVDLHSDFMTGDMAEGFADILRAHHRVSREPFTKDKFEHAMERLLQGAEHDATLAPRGYPGRDLDVDGARWSLKTQADANIKMDEIHISKFMELGRGVWESEEDLPGLRDRIQLQTKAARQLYLPTPMRARLMEAREANATRNLMT